MSVTQRANTAGAYELANKHWNHLHYSGQGYRFWQFKKALEEAIELGRALEHNRILEAIKPEEDKPPVDLIEVA